MMPTMMDFSTAEVAASNISSQYISATATPTTIERGPALPILRHHMYSRRRIYKRTIDILLAAIGVVLLFPFMLIVASTIKLTSRGPVFFKQRRTGYNKIIFLVWKFRTMRHDSHCAQAPYRQASHGDERVTAVGRVLRRLSIDEIPQLINVLRGEMSLVGPRPHPLALDERFRHCLPLYDARYQVLPGITGLAQVNGCRGETDTLAKMANRVEYDMLYVRNWSIGLDIRILLRTLAGQFLHPNAY